MILIILKVKLIDNFKKKYHISSLTLNILEVYFLNDLIYK